MGELRAELLERGACVASDAMLPPSAWTDRGAANLTAALVCRGCEVRTACYRYAIDTGAEVGVWGGVWFGQQGPSGRVPR